MIEEIRRVLKPGGIFSFISLNPASNYEIFPRFMGALGEINRRENSNFKGWGDSRVWSMEGLQELFYMKNEEFMEPIHIFPFDVCLFEPVEKLCDRLMDFFYSANLQSESAREELRSKWQEILKSTVDKKGQANFIFPSAQLSFYKT